MTSKGEDITQEGENFLHPFRLKRDVMISYSDNLSSLRQLNESISQQGFSVQIIFVLTGTITLKSTGLRKPLLVLKEQQHNLIASGSELRLSSGQKAHDLVCVHVDFAFLSRYLSDEHPGYLTIKRAIENDKSAVFSEKNIHITPEINSILNALRHSGHSGFCEKLFIESKTLELLALQICQFEQPKTVEPQYVLKEEDLEKMFAVKEILADNLANQISLRSLAHMVGTNEFNLKRNFKLAFGNTVFGYQKQYKMEQAKTLLIETNISLSELATRMGYKYTTHFSSAFKKHFGYLPNKIR